jgi:hypothetical protein
MSDKKKKRAVDEALENKPEFPMRRMGMLSDPRRPWGAPIYRGGKAWYAIDEVSFDDEASADAPAETDDTKLSLRQKVILLLILLYGKPEVPDGKKAAVSRQIHQITGGSFKNLKSHVEKPLALKDNSARSMQNLIDDLKVVSAAARNLGLSSKIADNLINDFENEAIDDLNEKKLKKNNRE